MVDITGTAGNDHIVQGNRPGIRIFALGGDDLIELDLEGDTGGSTFVDAGDGNDTVINDDEDGNEILLGRGDDIYIGNGSAFSLDQSDVVRGGDGNDTFAVTTDKSVYFGDAGNDLFVSKGDTNTFNGGAGIDTISYELRDESSVVGGTGVGIDLEQGFALTGNTISEDLIDIENATGTNADDEIFGSAVANRLSGRDGDDQLVGRAGTDRLDGGTGADEMIGGAGGDVYVVDNVGDIVDELNDGGSGIDTVLSSITFSLAPSARVGGDVERLTLTGAANINATGNALANTLVGNSGANVLNGLGGADIMSGGAGSDTYFVDNIGDVVNEVAGAGTDTVNSTISFSLSGRHIENLVLIGSGNINGIGNEFDNTITGNAGANTLQGGPGADRMIGGNGADIYFVDNVGDVIVETSTGGIDRVVSSISFILGATLENLTLNGAAAINGTGNALNNNLIGNAAANQLNGRTGADRMQGLGGNDVYRVDNVGDVVVELDGGGIDTVISTISETLDANVERLTLSGTANINGTGNALANIIIGNAGANIITGGLGADILTGGAHVDTFVYATTSESTLAGFDRITDLSNADHIDLSAVDANTRVGGNQAFSIVDAFSNVAGQMTVTFSSATGLTTFLMDVNGDSVADMKIVANGDHDQFTGITL